MKPTKSKNNQERNEISLTPTTDEVSELSGSRAKVSSCGNGVENTPRPIAAVERPSVSTPVNFDTLLLQGEEHHESGNGDST